MRSVPLGTSFGMAGRFDHNVDRQINHGREIAGCDIVAIRPTEPRLGGGFAEGYVPGIDSDRAQGRPSSFSADVDGNAGAQQLRLLHLTLGSCGRILPCRRDTSQLAFCRPKCPW